MSEFTLPLREGPPPKTLGRLPHSQLTQHGPDDIVQKLHDYCFALEHVLNEQSGISVAGSRALVLHHASACNHDAFMVGREFAHIHPHPDSGSMHLMLSETDAKTVVSAGFGEDHYLVTQGILPAGLIMVYSPRNDMELEAVKMIVNRSYAYATTSQTQ